MTVADIAEALNLSQQVATLVLAVCYADKESEECGSRISACRWPSLALRVSAVLAAAGVAHHVFTWGEMQS